MNELDSNDLHEDPRTNDNYISENSDDDDDDDSSITRPLPISQPTATVTTATRTKGSTMNLFRKGSLHIIPATLAKIANVPRNRVIKSTRRSDEKDASCSLDRTLENQLETLLDIIDPEKGTDPVVGVASGTNDNIATSIHPFESSNNLCNEEDDLSNEDDIEGDDATPLSHDDLQEEQPERTSSFGDKTVTKENKEEIETKVQSSIADCICPFPSPFESTIKDDDGEKTVPHANANGSGDPDNGPYDNNERNESVDANEQDLLVNITCPMDETEDDALVQASNPTLLSSGINSSVVTTAKSDNTTSKVLDTNQEEKDEDNDDDTCQSGLASPNNDNSLCESADVQSFTRGNTTTKTSIPKSINPPAKWSIFTPFITKYLDAENTTNLSGKDPVGKSLVDDDDKEKVDTVEVGSGSDPIGTGPILSNQSIDKNVIPPWDRADPPIVSSASDTMTETSDIEEGEVDNMKLEDGISKPNSTDNVECTVTGPVERLFVAGPTEELVVLPFDSASIQAPIVSKTSRRASPMKKGSFSWKCQVRFVLLLFAMGALATGIYFFMKSKESTRVVSASTSQTDVPPESLVTSKAPKASSSGIVSVKPTFSPIVPSSSSSFTSNKPTRAPTTKKPTEAPAVPRMVSPIMNTTQVENNNATDRNGDGDLDVSTDDSNDSFDDDMSNTDDGEDGNSGDDDTTRISADDGSGSDDMNNNIDDGVSGTDDATNSVDDNVNNNDDASDDATDDGTGTTDDGINT